jgi:hypothetical protein
MVTLGQPVDGIVPVAIVIVKNTENQPPRNVRKPLDFNLPFRDGYVLPRYYTIPENKLDDVLNGSSSSNSQVRQKLKDFKMEPADLEKLVGYARSEYLNDLPDDCPQENVESQT